MGLPRDIVEEISQFLRNDVGAFNVQGLLADPPSVSRLVDRDVAKMPLFLLELLLHTAIEEECDVGILLSFCDIRLLKALLGEPLDEDIRHTLRRIYGRPERGSRRCTSLW